MSGSYTNYESNSVCADEFFNPTTGGGGDRKEILLNPKINLSSVKEYFVGDPKNAQKRESANRMRFFRSSFVLSLLLYCDATEGRTEEMSVTHPKKDPPVMMTMTTDGSWLTNNNFKWTKKFRFSFIIECVCVGCGGSKMMMGIME
jgi:hypothetical protein